MRAYGAKRTFARCWTSKKSGKKKIHVRVTVKNRKRERALAKKEQCNG